MSAITLRLGTKGGDAALKEKAKYSIPVGMDFMKSILRFLARACLVPALTAAFAPAPAHADAVMDWNGVALDSVVAAKQTPPMTARSMAMVHAAMFDAVNAVEP